MKNHFQHVSDEELWEAFVFGDDEIAFEFLYKRFYAQLVRFAWRYLKTKAVAEELVQELFADCWENGEEWDLKGSVKSYFYKIVRNESLNYLKHKRVENKYDPEWMSTKEVIMMPEFKDKTREEQIRQAIKQAVEELPERSRMTYKLHRYDGLTYEEIAEVMGVSVKTVESQMTRTLKILRNRLAYLMPFFLVALRIL